MRRVIRIAGYTAAGVSLLLFASTLIATVRSYFFADGFEQTTRDATIYSLKWDCGRLHLVKAISDPSAFVETPDSLAFEKPKAGFEHSVAPPGEAERWGLGGIDTAPRSFHLLGVHYQAGKALIFDARHLSVPMGYLMALFAVPPAIVLERWRRRRKARRLQLASRCTRCGYDLRASPGRCPECGLIVTPS